MAQPGTSDPPPDLHVRLVEITVSPHPRESRARERAAGRRRALARGLAGLALALAAGVIVVSLAGHQSAGSRAGPSRVVECLAVDVAGGPATAIGPQGAPTSGPCSSAYEPVRRCLASLRALRRTLAEASPAELAALAHVRSCAGGPLL